ncbi:MAG: thioesterase family protein [Actinomycetia bacterium]|nr:thioesterase family protein [Actinomycetes bacterium]MCH9800293.1 thioesterase family protein [Actinomycetes bacterium]
MPQRESWAAASAVTQQTDGRFEGQLADGWDILGATNGGYILAVMAKAMAESAGREAPATVTGHFLAPARSGPISIATTTAKAGRRLTTVRASASADSQLLTEALGAFGAWPDPHDLQLQDGEPPTLPEPTDCLRIRSGAATWAGPTDETPPLPPPFMDRVELRLHPADAGFMMGEPSGHARMRAWFRLLDDEPLDPFALIVAADCLPPTTFNAGLPIAWTPTVELTVHVRARPAPGYVKLDYRSRFVGADRLEVDGLIWDEDDRLIAQSRQLALVPQT